MLKPYDLVKRLILKDVRYILLILFCGFLSSFCFCPEGFSVSITKNVEGIELNWSTSRFRSSGNSKIEEFSTAGISSADTKAWDNGLFNIGEDAKKLVSALIPGVNVSEADLSKLEKSVKSSSYTVNTEYYGKSGIRVILENRISKIYKLMNLSFLSKDKGIPASKNTGIIFRLSSRIEPRGVYTLYDISGNILFSTDSIYEEAFDYSTMGRWFNSSSKTDITRVVGDNPITVNIDVKDNRMVVSDFSSWNAVLKDNAFLLANVKIAIVMD